MFIRAGGLSILVLFVMSLLATGLLPEEGQPHVAKSERPSPSPGDVTLDAALPASPAEAEAPPAQAAEVPPPASAPQPDSSSPGDPAALTAIGSSPPAPAATPPPTANSAAIEPSPSANKTLPGSTAVPTHPATALQREITPAPPAAQRYAPSPTATAEAPGRSATIAPTSATSATPAIGVADSATGNALHCDVDGAGLSESERTAMLGACPAGSPAVCGTSLLARINETPAGGILNLTGCSYTSGAINITRAITIIGPTVSFPTANSWGDGVWLNANNITLDRWTFLSAGLPIGFAGVQNIQILNSKFEGYTGGPIGMWGEVRHVLIEGNVMKNTRNVQSGFVGGRGNEGVNPCPQVGRYVTIRGNVGDQNTNGWFGIELKCFEDVLIERNSLKGGQVLISLPDSNRVTIRDNNLDLRGTPYWGVEVAKAHDVRMENNTVQGDGPSSGDDAFSANSGSLRSVVYRNLVTRVRTLYAGPLQADIRWNCLTNVAFVTQFGVPDTSTISSNGLC